jgi:predicted alpha-1,2-mannosidase
MIAATLLFAFSSQAEENSTNGQRLLWQIGQPGATNTQFALAPANYGDFLERFGSPDHAYYVGLSNPRADWPYVLPGTLDHWAGSFLNKRTQNAWDQMNTLPIGFVLSQISGAGQSVLIISLRDSAPANPPRLRVTVNSAIFERDLVPGGSTNSLRGDFADSKPQTLRFEFPSSLLKAGYNEIALRSTSGSWMVFDALRLDAPVGIKLAASAPTVIRAVSVAPYAVAPGTQTPATIRIKVFRKDSPGTLNVQIGQGKAQEIALEPGLQVMEIAAPASSAGQLTPIRLSEGGHLLYDGSLFLSASPPVTPADYVDVFMGTEHSRWMIAPGPWMPFSMVKISPDNQIQSWCAGYEYSHDYIDCFSHIHEWTMAGLGMMPTVGALRTHPGLDETGYSSHFDKSAEHGGIGFYDVFLKDSGIKVELTATTRASLQRYTFPASDQARVLFPFLLPNEYPMHVLSAKVRRTATNEIEGDIQTLLPHMYKCDQHYVLHFVSQFSRPFEALDGWQNLAGPDVTIERGFNRPTAELTNWPGGQVISNAQELALSGDCGAIARFKTTAGEQVEVRTGISLVSVEDARLNLEQELSKPFGWNFDAVVQNQRSTWNDLLDRVEIETPNAREKTRFYSSLYRALSGRNIWSDVNGQWIDPEIHVQTLTDSDTTMLGCDALWTTFWNLNPLMNLMSPEWSERWVKSELELYDKCGWLAKGPAGLKYIDVMVAEHEIPLMVAAYQSGITNLDAEKILAACVKMQTSLPQNTPGGGRVGNESLESYLKYGYIVADGPLKGNTSETFEYAYDDWCVGQLALSLGHKDIAAQFLKRSHYWTNTFDTQSGFIRPRKANGDWVTPFDPYRTPGFVEGNAWQYTWFVPQDIPGLVKAMGRDRFIKHLNQAFEKMAPLRFNANGPGCPINQGNETTMHAPWLFNWAGQPWLTQKWTRAVLDSYYGNNPADAYPGDDDQGQMSAWFVMSAMGLFQTDGGCGVNTIYEIGSPLYPKTTIHLSNKYYGGKTFVIEAHNASTANRYIQSASLNGRPLNQWWIRQRDVLQGGRLVLELGPVPNKNWAKDCPLPEGASL